MALLRTAKVCIRCCELSAAPTGLRRLVLRLRPPSVSIRLNFEKRLCHGQEYGRIGEPCLTELRGDLL